jgi:hypothetical protein
MKAERHHNQAEIGETLPAELAGLRDLLRADLLRAAEKPSYFWARQRANIRERLVGPKPLLRWSIAAMAAIALVSLALLAGNRTASAPPQQAQRVDADDLLLKDIQHSLAHRAPEPLMPASVLVQEITANSRNQQKRDN